MQVTELVTESYYLSGVVSSELESVSSAQLSRGLSLLNDILNNMGATGNRVPYRTLYEDNYVVGQEKYFIPGLIEAETVTFFNGTIRYAMEHIGYRQYMGGTRVENLPSFPSTYTTQKKVGGSNLYVYFQPYDDFRFNIYGKFFLTDVSLSTDISEILDGYYITYLKFKLSEYLCLFNNLPVQEIVSKEIHQLESNIFEPELPDMSVKKSSTMGDRKFPSNIAQANMYRGLFPG